MPQKPLLVCALYDYNRQHTDELSFKKGDVITVKQQLEGGWWEGSLNGVVGWFPSNYVTLTTTSTPITTDEKDDQVMVDDGLLIHLQNFQNEIIQHILEGELRQINELSQLLSIFMVPLEPLLHLSFLNKLIHLKDLLQQAIRIHQHLASALNEMKCLHGPKCIGRLFLEFAPAINAVGCDYSKIYLHIITGLEEHNSEVTQHMASFNINFQSHHCKQQLTLVFERLGRYPLLLKEMERYLEEPHIDRVDILRAMHVYGEIAERCAILRKFKEYDINVLLSTINGWQGQPIQQLGDPILTLRVLLVSVHMDQSQVLPDFINADSLIKKTQLSLLVIFPACVLLLAKTNQPNVYDYTTKIPLNCLTVVSSTESETDLDLLVSDPNSTSMDFTPPPPCQISLACTDQNARDLMVSTLTDLIQYQIQNEQQQQQTMYTEHICTENENIPADSLNLSDQNNSSVLLSRNEQLQNVKYTEDENLQLHHQYHHHHSPHPCQQLTTGKEYLNSKLSNSTVDNKSINSTTKTSPANIYHDDVSVANSSSIITTPATSSSNNKNEKCRISSLKRSKTARPLTEPSSITIEQQLNINSQLQKQQKPHQQSSLNLSNKLTSESYHTKQQTVSTVEVFSNTDKPTTASSSLRYLPHRITTDAHVRWFEEDKPSVDVQQKYPYTPHNKNNEESLSISIPLSSDGAVIHAIRCLRIDGPLDIFNPTDRTGSVNGLNNLGVSSNSSNGTVGNITNLNTTSGTDQTMPGGGVRPQSPKMIESGKESRRKRGGTCQLLCNHENELRTADDTKILQVIEAYCASSWTQHSCRTLDPSKTDTRVNQSILSPVETKTLLQHFRHPKKSSTSLSSSVHYSKQELIPGGGGSSDPVGDTTNTTTTSANSASMIKLSRQSLPQSILMHKSSLKRSESKNKSQTCLTKDFTGDSGGSSNTTPGGGGVVNTSDNLIKSKPSSNYKHLTQSESVIQTLSPPPVVLPTRSGRR
uniref:SH3 domain-containing protein n=1 Tax=Trichobilharzia regenti TaxID=157069 RepID=A0AA85IXM3_TRIRE|nr:unnamed protein product [Trichobilharzia regenti]